MTICVFTGPTLSAEEARQELDAVYLPPVSQGDVYRVGLGRPRAIGIIDGYFEHRPAVWHKEILWAMTEGIHVFGSASMGALRAAELAPFGMEGVGAIFEAFRDGTLEDDDEVAVAHGAAETGYRLLSEAMVNVRCTLEKARHEAIISETTRAALERLAKDMFYAERTFPELLRRGAEQGMPTGEISTLNQWLAGGRVDQKRLDAVAMLRAMRARLAETPGPGRVQFRFEHTVHWERGTRLAGGMDLDEGTGNESTTLNAVLDELRLEPSGAYERVLRQAMLRDLSLAEFRRRGYAAPEDSTAWTTATFRRTRALEDVDEFARWLDANTLHEHDFDALMRDEAAWQLSRKMAEPTALRRVPDQLRVNGQYGRLLARARHKQRLLRDQGLDEPTFALAGASADQVLRWWAERTNAPAAGTLEEGARAAGFPDVVRFVRALLREYCYARLTESEPAAGT